MAKQPNFYAMTCDELVEYMEGQREHNKRVLAKSKKTKEQIENLGKAGEVVKNVTSPSFLERLRRVLRRGRSEEE